VLCRDKFYNLNNAGYSRAVVIVGVGSGNSPAVWGWVKDLSLAIGWERTEQLKDLAVECFTSEVME
jgi:hypothetical protein